jgi:nucleotide-binding universal stress UspA family protein
MSETRKLRRILLPLDLSRDSLAALETALGLAAALDGEVLGLFIEDEQLLAAANLPFAREVGSFSGLTRRIEGLDMERSFRATADKARNALAANGRRLNVRSSFQVSRGNVAAEILTATSDTDLVVLGKAGWSIAGRGEPGSTCRAMLLQTRVPMLIVEGGMKVVPPVLVTDDDSPAGRRAHQVAKQISDALDWNLVVLAIQGISGSAVTFEDMRLKPRLLVLPLTPHSNEHAYQLKCPLLFVP